jgi:hypothetical protein
MRSLVALLLIGTTAQAAIARASSKRNSKSPTSIC